MQDFSTRSSDMGLMFMLMTVISMGCLLNFLLFLCTVHNSALTTSLTGSLKSICQTIIGMFTFGGIDFNVFTLSGIAVNLSGGLMYTLAKYRDHMMKGKMLEMCPSLPEIAGNTKVKLHNGNGLIGNGAVKSADTNV